MSKTVLVIFKFPLFLSFIPYLFKMASLYIQLQKYKNLFLNLQSMFNLSSSVNFTLKYL